MPESNKTREENGPSGKQDTMRNCNSKILEFETAKSKESFGQAMLYDDSTSIHGSATHRKNVGYQNHQEEWLYLQTNYKQRTENEQKQKIWSVRRKTSRRKIEQLQPN